jgi:hypothetical protein
MVITLKHHKTVFWFYRGHPFVCRETVDMLWDGVRVDRGLKVWWVENGGDNQPDVKGVRWVRVRFDHCGDRVYTWRWSASGWSGVMSERACRWLDRRLTCQHHLVWVGLSERQLQGQD